MAIDSPFGTFYASNITPDPTTGIGGWSGSDFIRALKHGRAPSGNFYYPAFPYRSYAAITDEDALDIGAWLMAQPAINQAVPDHDLPAWIMRWQMAGWNRLADWSEPDFPEYADAQIARGAYLSRHLGHCGECHSPRNSLGLVIFDQEFAGGDMADGHVKGIDAQAMARWSEEDLALFLFLGLTPDGEFVGGKMEPVIEHNTGRLSDEDRQAMAAFFKRGL
jgi:mono/diheme cytochrome c family protein